jgi:phosphotransferase system HPr (HPr) family protein
MSRENSTPRRAPVIRAQIEARVWNPQGLHGELARGFVQCANRFQSSIQLVVEGREFSAHWLAEVLDANLRDGTAIRLVAEGPDAENALKSLASFLDHLAVVENHLENNPGGAPFPLVTVQVNPA